MSMRMVQVGDAELCVETFGTAGDPALVLISGAAASMDWWETEFCERLASGGRYVVRYDHRDTGGSTTYPKGEPGYDGSQLVSDVIGILDGLELPVAHLVGLSMGGGMAQAVAGRWPERVVSLVLLSTSPAGPGAADRPALPPMRPELAAAFATPPPEPDWGDRDAVIAYLVDGERAVAGRLGIDEPRLRAVAGRVFDRSPHPESMSNHWATTGDDPTPPRLDRFTAPTLVLHGTDDPMFPIAHGEALAREIPYARLIRLDGVGHQVPPYSTWDVVVPAILDHTAPG